MWRRNEHPQAGFYLIVQTVQPNGYLVFAIQAADPTIDAIATEIVHQMATGGARDEVRLTAKRFTLQPDGPRQPCGVDPVHPGASSDRIDIASLFLASGRDPPYPLPLLRSVPEVLF